ncbi:hypothetical protein C8J56DRAFT_749060, partial [Mycena floridula]
DKSTILVTLALVDQDFQKYDKEISRVEAIVEEIKRSRDALLQYRDRCSSLISAMHQIPVEIWTEIFSLACSGVFSGERRSFQTPATNISSVCSLWRSIMVSLPDL